MPGVRDVPTTGHAVRPFSATTPRSGGRAGALAHSRNPSRWPESCFRAEYFNNLATASRLKGKLSKKLQSWGKRKSRMDNKLFSSQR